MKIAILIPIAAIKVTAIVTDQAGTAGEIARVEVKAEMITVEDIRVIIEIVTVMRTRSVGDPTLLCPAEVTEIEKITLEKLDRLANNSNRISEIIRFKSVSN